MDTIRKNKLSSQMPIRISLRLSEKEKRYVLSTDGIAHGKGSPRKSAVTESPDAQIEIWFTNHHQYGGSAPPS